jgi:hypothetical protein
VGTGHAGHRHQQRPQLILPTGGRIHREVDLLEDPGGHALQEFLLVANVPVERHGGNAKPAGEFPDRNRFKPICVGERERILYHEARREGDSAGCFLVTLFIHTLTIVQRTG